MTSSQAEYDYWLLIVKVDEKLKIIYGLRYKVNDTFSLIVSSN